MWIINIIHVNSCSVSEACVQRRLNVGVGYSVLPQPVQEMHLNVIYHSKVSSGLNRR